MDSESTLQEYEIQLEQVEIALKNEPNNEELLKLKEDLIEVINLTKELIKAEADETQQVARGPKGAGSTTEYHSTPTAHWKTGDRCMAIWRVDAKYYPATVDQVLDDGTCTVIFDGYKTTEITQVNQLMPYNPNHIYNSSAYANKNPSTGASQVGHKKAFTKKELELKLKEAKKRKKEKFVQKIKLMDELSEREKNRWKSFNSKLASKTWKGVVRKNKFETPADHESKIGVGTNSLSNRLLSATGTILLAPGANTSAAASASLVSNLSKSRQSSQK